MAKTEPDWVYDPFDEGSAQEASRYTISHLKKILEENYVKTNEIVSVLESTSPDLWSNNAPIAVKYIHHEKSSLSQIIDTDNKNFNKVLRTIVYVHIEMVNLRKEAENRFIPSLLCYGEGKPDKEQSDASSVPLQMARMLPLLQDLSSFVHRCSEVVRHVVQQLACLYDPARKAQGLVDVFGAHFIALFEVLCDLLAVLIALDLILCQSDSLLHKDWELYKRMITTVKHDPDRFGYKVEQLKPFEKILMTLQGDLLEGKIFQSCVEQVFDDSIAQPSRISVLAEEFLACLKIMITHVESRLENADPNFLETDERFRLVGICGFFVLHYHIFRNVDRRLFRTVWDLHKLLPAVVLYGRVVCFITDFLRDKLPQLQSTLDRKTIASAESGRHSWLLNRSNTVEKDMEVLATRTAAWVVHMDTWDWRVNPTNGELLLEGLSLAYRTRHLVTTLLAVHTKLGKPMRPFQLLAIGRLLERLKDIEVTYFRRVSQVADALPEIIERHVAHTLKILAAAKEALKANVDKRYSDKRLDILSGVLLAENALLGPSSFPRRIVAQLGVAFVAQLKVLTSADFDQIRQLLRRLELFAELDDNVRQATDCAFFLYYFRGGPLELFLKELQPSNIANTGSQDINRLLYLLLVMRDAARPLMAVAHHEKPQDVLNDLESEVINLIERLLLQPLCQEIEKDLRLQTHTHLHLDDRNPLRNDVKTSSAAAAGAVEHSEDLSQFLRCRPLRFINKFVNIRAYVEHYLDATFYNLTTVALHDWKVYGEMKKIAQHKYGLFLIEPHLPSQTLEQGLDVLVIMRKINIFVENHNYNLNNQIFVEKSSKNKHLNTINIRHMANSIRTHGIGIMNTTVNFTYQYLKDVLVKFYEFLCHEKVKARLLKENNFFRENHATTNQRYPFERAEALNRNMRALGQHPKLQLTFWDLFRQVITHIGNAMGYVRLVRSGGLQCCSRAIRFVPDLEDIPNFRQTAEAAGGVSAETLVAAEHLDTCVQGLATASSGGIDFLRVLVSALGQLRVHKQELRTFPSAIPALTINFVDHISATKERLNKKNKEGAAFTDDGFAMGVAFLLKVLDMYHEFDALHWEEAVKDRMDRERARLRQQLENSRLDEKFRQTLTLALRRLDSQEREYEMLRFSLRSARIFFRADLHANEDSNNVPDAKSSGT